MLTREKFVELFSASLELLAGAEATTKRELKALSRSLLSALHGTDDALLAGDIQFINQLLPVLTNVHQRVAVLFFKAHAGFYFDDKMGQFTKKDGIHYAECKAAAEELLADPNQNLFTWADREIKIEAKPFKLAKVTTFIEGAIKKADKEGIAKMDVLKAAFAGGFTMADLIVIMDELAQEEAARAGQ